MGRVGGESWEGFFFFLMMDDITSFFFYAAENEPVEREKLTSVGEIRTSSK